MDDEVRRAERAERHRHALDSKEMTLDYYHEARRIAGVLRKEGLADVATAVEEAMDGGSMATEILMGIRFNLEKAMPRASDTTASQIRSLLHEVTRALDT